LPTFLELWDVAYDPAQDCARGDADAKFAGQLGRVLRFSLSYRDVEELLAERGLHADHVTVWRWVQRYAPEMERRLCSELKPTNASWRVDSDLDTGQGQVGLFIPRGGFHRGDHRLPSFG
jgi:hypothetical protein